MIAKTTFRPFSDNEWNAYAGVQTRNPLIGEYNNFIIIIDGEVASFVDALDDNWAADEYQFQLCLI
jgi:hypothetical protein